MAVTPRAVEEPLAIVGISCRFPGGVNSPDTFWRLLRQGVDAIGPIPASRWDTEAHYHHDRSLPGKTCARLGGFLERVDLFDADFFGIAPREASRISPQHRLLLELAWEALEDAGFAPERLAGSKTGVFVGISCDEYGEQQFRDLYTVNAYTCIGSSLSIAANRLSYYFDFTGPSLVVDTACSSSLVATHVACRSLWSGECNLALVGGVNLLLGPDRFIGFSQAHMLSPDGRCRAFDADASGYVRAEGGGIIVLKPLSKALADADPICAVIRATGINQDGRTTGLSFPNEAAQEMLLREVYGRAAIKPQQVQYIEAHGTGTTVGDPIECAALGHVLGEGRQAKDALRIGSVKTNIGHLEAGSGIAGLIKVALALHHGEIPASLHFQAPNPAIDFDSLRLEVQKSLASWPHGQHGAIAGVNSFGFGGTNAHVVLQHHPSSLKRKRTEQSGWVHLLPLSARSTRALEELATAYRHQVQDEPEQSLADLCYSASVRRDHLEHRLAVVASSARELAERLAAFLTGERSRGILTDQARTDHKPRVAFVFSGNGPQWWAMGRRLLDQEPVFRQAVEMCDRLLCRYTGWSLLDELRADEADSRMSCMAVAQPALFALQVGLLELWKSWGVQPDAVAGHSVGEVAAVYAAGVLTLEEAVLVIYHRSRTQETTAGRGKMVAVELSAEQAEQVIASYNGSLSVAAINAPTSVTLSGDSDALQAITRTLEEKHVYCRPLRLNYAFHSRHMDSIREDLLTSLQGLHPKDATLPCVSTVTGEWLRGPECQADYWWGNIRRPVLFAQAAERLLDFGCTVFIEVGPHPVLTSYLTESSARRGVESRMIPSLRRQEDDRTTLLGSLGALYTVGVPVDWSRLHPEGGTFVRLPTYPWQRESHWHLPTDYTLLHERTTHPLLGRRVESPQPQWHARLDLRLLPYLTDHKIQHATVFPGAGFQEMALAAGFAIFGRACQIEDAEILEALMLDGSSTVAVQLTVESGLTFSISSRIPGADEKWRMHYKGRISSASPSQTVHPWSVDDVRSRCLRELTQEEIYHLAARRNYHYGPAFRGLQRLWLGNAEALGEVSVPPEVQKDWQHYHLHPSLLDACGQSIIPILPNSGKSSERTTWLPVGIDRYHFFHYAGTPLFVHVRLVKVGKDWLAADFSLQDPAGQVVAELEGVRLQAINLEGGANRSLFNDWLYQYRWEPKPLPSNETLQEQRGETWIVFCDAKGLGRALADRHACENGRAIQVEKGQGYHRPQEDRFLVNPARREDLESLLDELHKEQIVPTSVIHCWSLDAAVDDETTPETLRVMQEEGCLSIIHLLQALMKTDQAYLPRLWLVTRGAERLEHNSANVSLAQAPLWGLGRVIMSEHPDLRCTLVDLDSSPAAWADNTRSLLSELRANEQEEEILLRNGTRYVHRLVRAPVETRGAIKRREELRADETFRLDISSPGSLGNLHLKAVRREQPGPGEVEVEVQAAGLNFKDVLQALGMISGEALEQGYIGGLSLGLECAGRVTTVGSDVKEWRPGDEVLGFGRNALGGHALTRADCLIRKPASMNFAEAATIPVAFCTAYYALCHVGRLQPGERVLIHGAAGGVGLAAVQIAQWKGAEVFATAGNAEKRDFLRSLGVPYILDSRSLSFADDIREITHGEGVDVVLNSLAGEAIVRSLGVLRPFGRFLEIGKRDLLQNSRLGLRPFEKCLSFHAIDLDQLLLYQPSEVRNLCHEVIELFRAGHLHPLPHRVFPLGEAENAFRYMQQARHIGKVVLSIPEPELAIQASVEEAVRFRSEASYLITGGLSGFGLATAQWMVENGARHLVLIGRSGAALPETQTALHALEQAGSRVVVRQVDVTQAKQVEALFAEIHASLPPLCGVIHSAGVIHDGIVLHLNRERFHQVVDPKVLGAWNLHRQTRNLSLDFFVCYSSVASVLGTGGQGSYAAGNHFLDMLASFRRGQGLPALTINWGPLADVGWLARHSSVNERLTRQGARALSAAQALQVLGRLLLTDQDQITVADIDWRQWSKLSLSGQVSSRLASLVQSAQAETSPDISLDLLATLQAGDNNTRRQLVLTFLCEQVAAVLGTTATKLDLHKPLPALGVDSLMAVELQVRIRRATDWVIPVMSLLERQTVSDLAGLLAERLEAKSRSC